MCSGISGTVKKILEKEMYENDQNSVNGELKQPKGFEQNENDEFAPAGEDSKNEFTAAESEPNGEPAGGSEYEWNHYDKTAAQPEPEQVIYKENVFMGVLGAVLFTIPGGALTFALSIFGYIAAISGIATAALAMLGYRIFSGANKNKGVKSSVASIVTSVIATFLMLLLAEFVVYSFVMSKNYGLTIFESMSVMPELLRDAEFRKYFITDVLGVWLFAAIGMGGYIWSLVKKGKTA